MDHKILFYRVELPSVFLLCVFSFYFFSFARKQHTFLYPSAPMKTECVHQEFIKFLSLLFLSFTFPILVRSAATTRLAPIRTLRSVEKIKNFLFSHDFPKTYFHCVRSTAVSLPAGDDCTDLKCPKSLQGRPRLLTTNS